MVGRSFPVWLGAGFGLGSAYTDCQMIFNPAAVSFISRLHANLQSQYSAYPGTRFHHRRGNETVVTIHAKSKRGKTLVLLTKLR